MTWAWALAEAASSAQQALVNWGANYDVSVATIDAGGCNQDIAVAISLPMQEAALMTFSASSKPATWRRR